MSMAENYGEGFEEGQRVTMNGLEAGARRIGLYLEHGQVLAHPENPDKLIFLADFAIGQLAWRRRVQDPEAAESDKLFRQLRIQAEQDEIERLRREHGET